MPFLHAFLDTGRVNALTDSDLETVQEMGVAIANSPNLQVHTEDVFLRLVQAYDERKDEKRARELLTRTYNLPSASKDAKTKCAHDLAQRGAKDDYQIDVYFDFLRHVSKPVDEKNILNLLGGLCAVDFDSGLVSLRRAGEVARRLLDRNLQVPRAKTALGLYTFLLERDTVKAIPHFEAAFQTNPEDKVALVGLLSTLVQSGDFSRAAMLVQGKLHRDDAIVTGLANLSATLHWLGNPDIADSPPCSTEQLSVIGLDRYAGEFLNWALGITHLLEGNARQAARTLIPLAERHPEQYLFNYYAAWSASLIGDAEAVARRFDVLVKWTGRWTVGCLLLDLDPALAELHGVQSCLDRVPSDYASVVAARLALARGESPAKINWKYNPGVTSAENLEAFRTMLGYAVYKRDMQTLRDGISTPLFRRLPLVDQLLWQGLYLVSANEPEQGRELLEEAAVRYEYKRSALVLSVHLLEQNRAQEAKQFLARAATNRKDVRAELLYAYIEALEGKTDSAAQRLDKLAFKAENRVYYALGNLYLRCADDSKKAGNIKNFGLFRRQAAGAFAAALKQGQGALPSDCEVLMRSAEFSAYPEVMKESHKTLWQDVKRLEASRRRKWLVWNAYLSLLQWGDPSSIAGAGEEALASLENVDLLSEPVQAAVASALANACVKAEDDGQADKLARQLELLYGKEKRRAVEPYYRLGVAAAVRLSYTKAQVFSAKAARQKIGAAFRADPGNVNLALALAQVSLVGKVSKDAVSALRNAQPEGEFDKRLIGCLTDLLNNCTVSLEGLPQPASGSSLHVVQACHLLRAAAAFAAGLQTAGFAAVFDALKSQKQDIALIFNFAKFLPSLCVLSKKTGVVPAPLTEAIHLVSSVKAEQAESVAKCAAALGEMEYACSLWEQALKDDPDELSGQEYSEFLCHLAVLAYNSGNHKEAAKKLRLAVKWGGTSHE